MSRRLANDTLGSLTRALRQCHLERRQMRHYATTISQDTTELPSEGLQALEHSLLASAPEDSPVKPFRRPSPSFRPGTVVRQRRPGTTRNPIPIIKSNMRSTYQICKDPLAKITQDQLAVLDPTGERERLFARNNPDRVKPGDVIMVRQKSGDPFAGVVLNIRQVHSKIDWAVLMRNQLTRIGVEMWYKVFSPNIEGIEIVQRKAKRARRNKLYYMRKPKHDMGSLENIVRQYTLAKAGLVATKKGKKAIKKR